MTTPCNMEEHAAHGRTWIMNHASKIMDQDASSRKLFDTMAEETHKCKEQHQLAHCAKCGWEVRENIATYEDERWTSQSLVQALKDHVKSEHHCDAAVSTARDIQRRFLHFKCKFEVYKAKHQSCWPTPATTPNATQYQSDAIPREEDTSRHWWSQQDQSAEAWRFKTPGFQEGKHSAQPPPATPLPPPATPPPTMFPGIPPAIHPTMFPGIPPTMFPGIPPLPLPPPPGDPLMQQIMQGMQLTAATGLPSMNMNPPHPAPSATPDSALCGATSKAAPLVGRPHNQPPASSGAPLQASPAHVRELMEVAKKDVSDLEVERQKIKVRKNGLKNKALPMNKLAKSIFRAEPMEDLENQQKKVIFWQYYVARCIGEVIKALKADLEYEPPAP